MSRVNVPKRLPVLFVSDGVIFPSVTVRIPLKNRNNVTIVEYCMNDADLLRNCVLAVGFKRTSAVDQPNAAADDRIANKTELEFPIEPIGTAILVNQVIGTNWPRPTYTLQVTGLCRVRFNNFLRTEPFVIANVTQLDRQPGQLIQPKQFTDKQRRFVEDVSLLVGAVQNRSLLIQKMKEILPNSPLDHIVDFCASVLPGIKHETLMLLLKTVDVDKRVTILAPIISERLKKLSETKEDSTSVEVLPTSDSFDEIKKIIDRFQRTPLMDVRRKDGGGRAVQTTANNELDKLEEKLKAAGISPAEVAQEIMNDFQKLKKMGSFATHTDPSLRNYLELVAELPWNKTTTDTLNVAKARHDLDADHYAMEDVKKRLLEFLAVRQLRHNLQGPILCLVGPPGVGKTSIASSVAKTLSRKFERVSLGGVSHESDIRGHRRTYVGSMPGRIIQAMKRAGAKNPVILLDEIDKLSSGAYNGDPRAALLEVLDPAQNKHFVDHYINQPFDLSGVLFIATANSAVTIPPALLDRMEQIDIAGYTSDEKVKIARLHLLPKQLKEHGLTDKQLQIPTETVDKILCDYTLEAGVRQLERQLAAVCRAVALRIASANEQQTNTSTDNNKSVDKTKPIALPPSLPVVIDELALVDILGPARFRPELGDTQHIGIGVAAGLAVTDVGGHVMYVETSLMPHGSGDVRLTGQLGSVMQESASLAWSWMRANCKRLPCPSSHDNSHWFTDCDVHIHLPAGAVSKDGPSAGITLLVALASLYTQTRARDDTAMTGEISLRGFVLPVGGIKSKVLAADRAGFTRVIVPQQNEIDVQQLPEDIKNRIEFVFASNVDQVLAAAFDTLHLQDADMPRNKL